jgi:hypothetical protein
LASAIAATLVGRRAAHVFRRHQASVVPKNLEFAAEMMGTSISIKHGGRLASRVSRTWPRDALPVHRRQLPMPPAIAKNSRLYRDVADRKVEDSAFSRRHGTGCRN